MDTTNPIDLLRDELENDDVKIIGLQLLYLDSNQSKCNSSPTSNHGGIRAR